MRLLPASFLLAGLLVASAPSQTRPGQFSAESAVIERFDTVIAMQADGTGYIERTVAIRIQSDAALRDLGVLSVPFAGASEHVDIKYARARRPDGTVIETPVADALEQPTAVTREAPFYSDQKTKQLPIRSLHVGDTFEWQARVLRTKAEAPHQFWGENSFDDTLITLEESLELHVPLASPAHVWTNPAQTPPAETRTATERVYRWQHTNLKPTVGKEAEDAAAAKKIKVLTEAEQLDRRQGKLPTFAWSTYPSWPAVGEWYRSLEQGRTTPDPEIKAKVAELTAGKTTMEDKVRAVYSYTSLQIRYIGVAFGIGRYQPHQASEVLSNQYGDCKDKHTLLAAMLTELGLHPEAVLIGQGIRFNQALPSPSAFNHLITQVAVEGKTVWLDSTEEVAPYGMLMLPLRDEQALVIPETEPVRLERTPADPPFASVLTMNAVGTLDKEGTSNSRITLSVRGDQELLMRAVLRQVPPANYPELIQKLSEGMGYGGTASHPEFGSPGDTGKPYTWTYDYKREKGGDWEHYKIVPQVAYRSLPGVDEKVPPVEDIDLGVPRTETSTAAMKLPQGWGAELPEAIHVKAAFATYDQTYRLADGTVYTEVRVAVTKRYIPVAEWRSYKKFVDQAGLDDQAFIQLTHVGGVATPRPGSGNAGESASSALSREKMHTADLLQEVNEALRVRDLKLATSLLGQVKTLDARKPGMWTAYAMVALAQGRSVEVIDDIQREIDLNPYTASNYDFMAQMQNYLHQTTGLTKTLRAWVDINPTDPRPVEQLMRALNDEGKSAEALTVGQTALTMLPEEARKNGPMLFTYGVAQLRSGKDAEGLATVTALIAQFNDPNQLNTAAYALAEAGKALPLAETTERGALAQLDRETASWTGAESPAVLAKKMQLLAACWDTMGWILFREGKLTEAQDYIDAAFHNRPDTVVGTHLGDIRFAAGDQTGARRAYQLSLQTVESRMMGADTPWAKAEKAALQVKSAAAAKAGARIEPAGDINTLRQVHLGPADNRSLSAEYRLLLNPKAVESAEPTGDKSVRGAVEMIKAMKLPHLFPAGSEAKLVKLAIVNCHAETCDLIFEP